MESPCPVPCAIRLATVAALPRSSFPARRSCARRTRSTKSSEDPSYTTLDKMRAHASYLRDHAFSTVFPLPSSHTRNKMTTANAETSHDHVRESRSLSQVVSDKHLLLVTLLFVNTMATETLPLVLNATCPCMWRGRGIISGDYLHMHTCFSLCLVGEFWSGDLSWQSELTMQ